MLAALTVVLLLPAIYLPVLGMLTLFIWPVPITVLGVRHGLRVSFLAMITAGLIASLLTHPLTAGSMVVWLGFLGLTLGYCFRHRYPPITTLGLGTLTVLASTMVLFLLSLVVFGVNPFTAWQEVFAESSGQVLEFYRQMGISGQQLAQMEELYSDMVEMFRYLLPATLLMGSVFAAFINFTVARLVMAKLGQPVPGLPSFDRWQFPRNMVWGYLAGILSHYGGNYYGISLLVEIGINVYVIFNLLFAVAGLAVVHYFLQQYRVHRILRVLATIFIVLNPVLFQLSSLLGIFDVVFNFRKI